MRNLTASIFYFLARVAAAILQLRFVAQFFGSQYAGLNALLNQLAYYVAMIELGLATAAISLLYEPIKANQFESVSGLLFALARDTRRLMLAALPVIAGLVLGYAHSIHSTLPRSIVIATLSLTAGSGLLTLLSIQYQAYLNASEQMYKIHLVLGFGHLAKTAIGVGLAVALHDYLWLPGVVLLVSAGEVLALRSGFHRAFPQYLPSAAREAYSLIRQRAKFVLFHRIGGLIYYQSDFIVLSLVTTLTLVKEYAQVQYIAMGIVALFTAIFNALTASIARRQLGVSVETRWRQYRAVAQATYFVALSVTLAFFFGAPDAVRIMFANNAPPRHTMVLFGALLLLNLIRTVDEVYVTATGAFHVAFYLPLVEGPVYITLGVLLSRHSGMNGVLWAGIVTNLIFVVMAKSMVVAHGVLGKPISHLAALRLWNSVVAVTLCVPLAALYMFVEHSGMPGRLHFLLISASVAIYSSAIAYIMIRRGYRGAADDGVPLPEEDTATRVA